MSVDSDSVDSGAWEIEIDRLRDDLGAALVRENNLLEALQIAYSWMRPWDVMGEEERFEYDRAHAEVKASLNQQGTSVSEETK